MLSEKELRNIVIMIVLLIVGYVIAVAFLEIDSAEFLVSTISYAIIGVFIYIMYVLVVLKKPRRPESNSEFNFTLIK